MASDTTPGRLYDATLARFDTLLSEGKLFYEPSEAEVIEYDEFTVRYSSKHACSLSPPTI